LVGVPHNGDGYRKELVRDDWGAHPVTRVTNYRGFVFGNFDAEAPVFEDYLGDMAFYFESVVGRYPEGLEFLEGVHKWRIKCNWKLPSENFAGDFYHAESAHAAAIRSMARDDQNSSGPRKEGEGLRAPGQQITTTHGHGTQFNRVMTPSFGGRVVDEYWASCLPDQIERLGETRAKYIRSGAVTIFPNFSYVNGIQTFRVWHPKGPGEIEVWAWIAVPKGASPEVKNAMRIGALRTFSPGGLFEQEDGENWGEVQEVLRGHVARNTKLNYAMGIGHEIADKELPGVVNYVYSETAARGLYRAWLIHLQSDSWDEFDERTKARKLMPAEVGG